MNRHRTAHPGLDFYDPAFLADPYPELGRVREATPMFLDEQTGQWMLTRFADVYQTLRDRRLGRVYHHRYAHTELGQPAPDTRWASFRRHERWSLLSLEPPDHTRIRKLVSKVFTSRSVARLGPVIAGLSRALVDRCRQMRTFDLLADYAQPYSVAVIAEVLGVPRADTQRLLDWSHAIVKMYELSASDELKVRADAAAGEFIDYTRALIADKRRSPDGRLVSQLARTSDGSDRLSDDEIVSTTMVLLEAGHEATVNALGNGMKALLTHREQWRRLVAGEVGAATAVEELLRWDSPCRCSRAGCSSRASRSPDGRWRWASGWLCSSGPRSATLAGSTTPTASTWRAATRATSASVAASTSAWGLPWPATSWPSPCPTWRSTFRAWRWTANRPTTPRS